MRIAYTHHAFTSQADGGVSKYYYSLLREFCSESYLGMVFSPLYDNIRLISLRDDQIYGVCVGKIYPGSRRLISIINDVVSTRAIKSWAPEVIHQTYYTQDPVFRNGSKVVLTVYDMIHELYKGIHFGENDPTLRKKIKSLRNADHIICISENTKKDLLEFYPECEEKVSVIHLGCDQLINIELRDDIQSLIDVPYLLCVGGRSGYKNFSRVLDAFAASETLKSDFMLVTCSYEPFTEQEIQKINDLGIPRERVRRVKANDSVLSSLYSNAVALIYPSLYEGFGLPPLEAMSLGCPVICSNTSSIPEIVGPAGKYFDPCDTESIRSAIEDVVYSDLERRSFIFKGYERVKKFTWDNCISETKCVYDSLL